MSPAPPLADLSWELFKTPEQTEIMLVGFLQMVASSPSLSLSVDGHPTN